MNNLNLQEYSHQAPHIAWHFVDGKFLFHSTFIYTICYPTFLTYLFLFDNSYSLMNRA